MHQSSISIKKYTRKTDWVRGWRWLEAKIMRLKQSLSQSGRPMLRSLTLTTKWRKSDFHLLNVPFGHHGRLSLRSTVCIYSLIPDLDDLLRAAQHQEARHFDFHPKMFGERKWPEASSTLMFTDFISTGRCQTTFLMQYSKFKCCSLNLRVFT